MKSTASTNGTEYDLAQNGVIILPRDVIEQLLEELELLVLMVFLVSCARYKPGRSPRGQHLVPGQAVVGKRKLGDLLGWTSSRAYRALKRLEERGLIELKADRRGTVVTISNWESYSRLPKRRRTNSGPRLDRERTNGEPESEQPRTQTKAVGSRQNTSSLSSSSEATIPPASVQPWNEVEEGLRERGVSSAKDAVERAQRNGVTPESAQQVLTQFDDASGAYGAGALFKRVTGALTDWPNPTEEHLRKKPDWRTA